MELTENEILGNKMSILEAENETLKQELSITQDAVNELIFNSLNRDLKDKFLISSSVKLGSIIDGILRELSLDLTLAILLPSF